MKTKKTAYKLPDYLEPFRALIECTSGGNSAETMMDRLTNEQGLAFSNIIIYTMACGCHERISLLEQLNDRGLLKEYSPR